MSTENTVQSQQDGGKDAKRFDQNLKKFMSLFSGKANPFKNKIPNSEVSGFFDEMLEENRQEVIERFKVKGKALILKKVQFDKFVKEEQAKTEKAILEKKKEFSKEMEALFQEMESIDELAKGVADVIDDITTNDSASTADSVSKD